MGIISPTPTHVEETDSFEEVRVRVNEIVDGLNAGTTVESVAFGTRLTDLEDKLLAKILLLS